MNGLYKFWYCVCHDDGAIVYSVNVNKCLDEIRLECVPEWLNVCCISPRMKKQQCAYDCKGIIEYKNGIVIEVVPVQTTFERENGGFIFPQYLQNVYDGDSNGEKTIEFKCSPTSCDNTYLNLDGNPLIEWFNNIIKEIKSSKRNKKQ